MKYGYLGPEGTFSEMAMLYYCGDGDTGVPLKTIEEIAEKVDKKKLPAGILPLENSLEGSINITQDLLFRKKNISITAEIVIPVIHNLMAWPGVKKEEIEKVLSHPQAIKQTTRFINRELPQVEVVYVDSTARAAEKVKNNRRYAMIGSSRIEELYDLNILARNVQNYRDNFTRFIVLRGKKRTIESGTRPEKEEVSSCKTSIICTPEKNRPGVLHDILGEFATRAIDLTRIESRPTKKKLGEYIFYIDLRGHNREESMYRALENVKQVSGIFKFLGSYPQYNYQGEIKNERKEA